MRPARPDVDVLIVGGGPAGLSAALVLGRCHRSVLVCDEGRPRNRWSHAVHGLLGHEGTPPSTLLETARGELSHYPTVKVAFGRVATVRATGDAFQYCLEGGVSGTSVRVLLASGIVDELPSIPGVETFLGISVHHCLYCDGFEYRGKSVAAYGQHDKGAALGLMMRHWFSDVVVCTDGTHLSDAMAERVRGLGIPVRSEKVSALGGPGGHLERIEFDRGPALARDSLFFSTGCHQASDLTDQLGCKRDEKGGLIVDPLTQETSSRRVYAAGDATRDVLLVSIAIAEGAKAAVAINKTFLREDGLID